MMNGETSVYCIQCYRSQYPEERCIKRKVRFVLDRRREPSSLVEINIERTLPFPGKAFLEVLQVGSIRGKSDRFLEVGERKFLNDGKKPVNRLNTNIACLRTFSTLVFKDDRRGSDPLASVG